MSYFPDLVQAVAAVALTWLLSHWKRHMTHLAGQLKEAGGRDLWGVRCAHCSRPLYDAATIAHTVTDQLPGGGTRTTTRMWHDDKPACAAAAIAEVQPQEAAP